MMSLPTSFYHADNRKKKKEKKKEKEKGFRTELGLTLSLKIIKMKLCHHQTNKYPSLKPLSIYKKR